MSAGTGLVDAKFRPIIRGVFAGPVHYARATTDLLFTEGLGSMKPHKTAPSSSNAVKLVSCDRAPSHRCEGMCEYPRW